MPTVVVDGLRVDYTDAGTGLPLVFVHGLFGSMDWFRYQASGLSDRHRVISYNLRPARGCADYSLELLARDLVRLLDRLRIHGAVVFGHTLGGMVALKFAADYPERALAVGTISSAPSLAGVSDEDIIERLSPGGEVEQEHGFFARLWKRFSGVQAPVVDESDPLSYLVRHRGAVDRATFSARLRLMRESDLTAVLEAVEAPTLVIAGANDWSRILSGSQALDQAISDSALEVIENADHFCFFTRHDVVNAAIDDFVSREVPRL